MEQQPQILAVLSNDGDRARVLLTNGQAVSFYRRATEAINRMAFSKEDFLKDFPVGPGSPLHDVEQVTDPLEAAKIREIIEGAN